MNEETLNILASKQPLGSALPFGTTTGPKCGQPPTKKGILSVPWTLSIPTRHPASVDGHQAAQDRRRITGGSQVLTTLTASINAGSYTEPLLPSQLGSKSKGGVKPIVRAVERALIGTMDQDYTHLVSLDAANASTPCTYHHRRGTPQILPHPVQVRQVGAPGTCGPRRRRVHIGIGTRRATGQSAGPNSLLSGPATIP